jgi:hypothetical protein
MGHHRRRCDNAYLCGILQDASVCVFYEADGTGDGSPKPSGEERWELRKWLASDGEEGEAPYWLGKKIVADWHNCSTTEAGKLPYREWLRAFAANEAEALAQKDREKYAAVKKLRENLHLRERR